MELVQLVVQALAQTTFRTEDRAILSAEGAAPDPFGILLGCALTGNWLCQPGQRFLMTW